MKIGVIIINFNGNKLTNECLESLCNLKWDMKKLNVYIVDNASKKKFETSKKFPFYLQVIYSEKNLGFSGGNNTGIRRALEQGCDYIMLLNNDTRVDKNLLSELIKPIGRGGISVPKIYFEKGFEYHKDIYKSTEQGKIIWYAGGMMDWKNLIGYHRGVDEVDRGQFDRTGETEFATGCCMMASNTVFENVGMLDERYFLYYEDSDFSLRARKKGFNITFAPKAVVWHKNAGSTGGSGSNLQDYYIARNRLFFGMRYAPFKTKILLLMEAFNLYLSGREWQKRGVTDYLIRRMGKGSYA